MQNLEMGIVFGWMYGRGGSSSAADVYEQLLQNLLRRELYVALKSD